MPGRMLQMVLHRQVHVRARPGHGLLVTIGWGRANSGRLVGVHLECRLGKRRWRRMARGFRRQRELAKLTASTPPKRTPTPPLSVKVTHTVGMVVPGPWKGYARAAGPS